LTPRLTFAFATAALCLATPVVADLDSGAYLAARQAGVQGDYQAASEYFGSALLADPSNLALMDQTITAFVGTGQIESAASLTRLFRDAGGDSQIANIAMMALAARTGDWDAIFEMLEAGHEVGPLIDGLAQGWAYVGNGDMDRAIMSFDEVIDTPGLRTFGQHHKALALTMNGDLAEAAAIYDLPPNMGVPLTRATVLAHLQILCQLGEFEKASGIVTRAFGEDSDPEIAALRNAIEAGETPPLDRVVATPAHGLSYAFKGLADILQGEANESYLLLYAQAARYISPQDADAQIATARLLNALGQYDEAAETFALVSTTDTAFPSAEIGRAEALRLAGRFEKSIEVLSQLTRSHPHLPQAFASLGDIHRIQENYEQARTAYDAAVSGYPEGATVRWWILYSRGMSSITSAIPWLIAA